MPHSGPRGSPVVDRRNAYVPVLRIAAETMLPAGISTETPFTESRTVSGMHGLLSRSRRQVRRDRNRRLAIHDLSDEQLRRTERGCDAKPFMPGGEIEPLVFGVWPN